MVRSYQEAKLIANTYGKLSSIALDPIEKKPLYHFYPGSRILSLGSIGCNLHCSNCQNENISQCIDINPRNLKNYSIDKFIEQAKKNSPYLLAFTYNEPIVSFEFMYDIAETAETNGIDCIMVTNGYILEKPLKQILHFIAGFNVDLKAFNNQFYRTITGGSLKPVLKTLELIKESDKHLEITYLVIPGLNDDPEEFKK